MLADFLANFTIFSVLNAIWLFGVLNYRFLGMLNPFLGSNLTFETLLADFLVCMVDFETFETLLADFLANFTVFLVLTAL